MSSSILSASDQKLLVTTSLESTWGNDEYLLLLGEWCEIHERRHVLNERRHEVASFHWDDRNKLKRDYDYLQQLHHKLLQNLTDSLNNFHNVEYSLRSWQVLLDPWLMSYISVLFDRWEALRLVFEKNESIQTILPNKPQSRETPFSYNELISQTQSDEWNFLLYSYIIENYYLDRCMILNKEIQFSEKNELPQSSGWNHRKVLEKVSTFVDTILGLFSSHYKVVFLSSCFSVNSLVKLSLTIRQMPRLFLKYFKYFDVRTEIDIIPLDRSKLSVQFEPQNQFENFLKEIIVSDIPVSVVEAFNSLSEHASKLKIKTKAIVTAGEHWGDIFAKFWFVDQLKKGVKLVVLEHGGSFPAFKELFNFEEDIADIRGTWFLPYHEKHVKVPPSKLINKYDTKIKKKHIRKYCSCIGSEQFRWVCRVHFYPMTAQCLTSFNWVLAMYSALNEDVKKQFKVKPYPNVGWDTKAMYENALGTEHIAYDNKLDDVFYASKVIVCTYPETTFSEAMMTGIPTILLYPEELYERNPVAYPLLDLLREAKLIFHDPGAAAKHLNSIWTNPDDWWNSPIVLNARAQFTNQAISNDVNWLDHWKEFVNQVIG